MSSVIKVEHLSKKFIIGHEQKESYTALRDVVARSAKKVFSFTRGAAKTAYTTEEFWALKNINFHISQGDRVGIIGRNGAGKSTLLKILSRITEPSSGSVRIRGRVASLLEVGTGFHPELTGRENIFLNGAILGMSRAEIKRKFDEIVAFAEVEKFLDTPVKRYSSGMYVRLAFAVAAHLEPEILIVDEVLAVGDAQFQKKCLGKMQTVSAEGRTVLFVSHNMTAIKSLCSKGVFLKDGQISLDGPIDEAINNYQLLFSPVSKTVFSGNPIANNSMLGVHSIEIENNNEQGGFYINEPLTVKINLINKTIDSPLNINLFFNAPDGTNVFATCSMSQVFKKDEIELRCKIPANFFNDNIYSIDIMGVTDSKPILEIKEALLIEGLEPPREAGWLGKFPGYVRPVFEWTVN